MPCSPTTRRQLKPTMTETSSLPSTLLKKTGPNRLLSYHDRVVPPPIRLLDMQEQLSSHQETRMMMMTSHDECSSVSTQSTPYSQEYYDRREIMAAPTTQSSIAPKNVVGPLLQQQQQQQNSPISTLHPAAPKTQSSIAPMNVERPLLQQQQRISPNTSLHPIHASPRVSTIAKKNQIAHRVSSYSASNRPRPGRGVHHQQPHPHPGIKATTKSGNNSGRAPPPSPERRIATRSAASERVTSGVAPTNQSQRQLPQTTQREKHHLNNHRAPAVKTVSDNKPNHVRASNVAAPSPNVQQHASTMHVSTQSQRCRGDPEGTTLEDKNKFSSSNNVIHVDNSNDKDTSVYCTENDRQTHNQLRNVDENDNGSIQDVRLSRRQFPTSHNSPENNQSIESRILLNHQVQRELPASSGGSGKMPRDVSPSRGATAQSFTKPPSQSDRPFYNDANISNQDFPIVVRESNRRRLPNAIITVSVNNKIIEEDDDDGASLYSRDKDILSAAASRHTPTGENDMRAGTRFASTVESASPRQNRPHGRNPPPVGTRTNAFPDHYKDSNNASARHGWVNSFSKTDNDMMRNLHLKNTVTTKDVEKPALEEDDDDTKQHPTDGVSFDDYMTASSCSSISASLDPSGYSVPYDGVHRFAHNNNFSFYNTKRPDTIRYSKVQSVLERVSLQQKQKLQWQQQKQQIQEQRERQKVARLQAAQRVDLVRSNVFNHDNRNYSSGLLSKTIGASPAARLCKQHDVQVTGLSTSPRKNDGTIYTNSFIDRQPSSEVKTSRNTKADEATSTTGVPVVTAMSFQASGTLTVKKGTAYYNENHQDDRNLESVIERGGVNSNSSKRDPPSMTTRAVSVSRQDTTLTTDMWMHPHNSMLSESTERILSQKQQQYYTPLGRVLCAPVSSSAQYVSSIKNQDLS